MLMVVRGIAFVFRTLNFLLDVVQTWQFAGGGGAVGVVTAVVAWLQGVPIWAVVMVSIAASFLGIVVLALVFRSYAQRSREARQLNRLPRLAYDIHKRITKVRSRLARKATWPVSEKLGTLLPLLSALSGENMIQKMAGLTDDAVDTLNTHLADVGKLTGGAASVLNAYMKDTPVSLEHALSGDVWYRVLLARLDSHRPLPTGAVRGHVQRILDVSISMNNVLIIAGSVGLQELEQDFKSFTDLSDKTAQQMAITVLSSEASMERMINDECTGLREAVEHYLRKGG